MEHLWEMNKHDFKTNLYRRIQLASAISVIKTTPKDKTPEIYAKELQERLKMLWLRKPSVQHTSELSFALDQHILSQQQGGLSKRLLSIIPQNLHPLVRDFSAPCSCGNEFTNESCKSPGLVPNTIKNNRSKIRMNVNFIQAVIQLNGMAETHPTIPIDLYIESVSKLVDRFDFRKCSRKRSGNQLVVEPAALSDDSDFHAFEESYNTNSLSSSAKSPSLMTGVASSMLMYVVNSGDANQLLSKSIEAILNQMKALACEAEKGWSVLNLNETINAWTGSIYQQAIKALHYLTEKQSLYPDITQSSRSYCFSFVEEMVAVLRLDVSDKSGFYQRENQMVMLNELCQGTSLWSQAIEFMLLNLNELLNSTYGKFFNSFACHAMKRNFHHLNDILNSKQTMAESFFLVQLVKLFLLGASDFFEKLCSQKRQHDPHGIREQELPNTLSHLWRRHYTVKSDSSKATLEVREKIRQTKSDLSRWKYILEESASRTIEEYPLCAVVYSECIGTLPVV